MKKKILIILSVITLVLTSASELFTKQAYAESVEDAQRQIDSAAEAFLTTRVMYRCLDHIKEKMYQKIGDSGTLAPGSIDDTWGSKDNVSGGEIFLREPVMTGVWFEKKVIYADEGDVGDGLIWCDEGGNMLLQFTKTMQNGGVDLPNGIADVMCNRKDGEKGGILNTYDDSGLVFGVGYAPKLDKGCNSFTPYYDKNDPDWGWVRSPRVIGHLYSYNEPLDEARNYLKGIYQEYVDKNSYAIPTEYIDQPMSSVENSNYGGYLAHIYRNDFIETCTTGLSDKIVGGSGESGQYALKTVNTKGEITDVYLMPNDGTFLTHGHSSDFFMSCGEMLELANNLAEKYQQLILNAIRRHCNTDEVKKEIYTKRDEAQAIVDNNNANEEEKNKAREFISKVNHADTVRDYTQSTPDGGLVCLNEDPNLEGGILDTEAEISTDSEDDVCYSNAGPLNWILCPVVQMASDFSKWFYGTVVEPQLEIQSSGIFEVDGGTYKAWSGFRDIANIIFVILFLAVIISQLTGYGIDNYGIKRILPRIIIAAILINLSYFICQIAVDVANILGVSVGNFLNSFVETQELNNSSSPGAGQYVFSFAAGAAVAAGVVLVGGLGAVITVVMAAISVVISLVFLLAILTARQAAVIILIVISPLALVCYLLPNTENLTKKWFKIAEAMLLLYPICSLIIAAGSLAGNIIASVAGDNTGMYIAAMLVNVVPYFAIPALVKNSMAGLGNIGARISNLGQRANRAAMGGLGKSETVKNARTALSNVGFTRARNALAERGIGRRRRISQIAADNERRTEGLKLQSMQQRNEQLRSPDWQDAERAKLANAARAEAVDTQQSLLDDLDNDALGTRYREILANGDDDDSTIARMNAIENILAERGEFQTIHDAHNGINVSQAKRNATANNMLSGKAARTFAKKDAMGIEWSKRNQVGAGDGVSLADATRNGEYFGGINAVDLASMNGAMRGETIAGANANGQSEQLQQLTKHIMDPNNGLLGGLKASDLEQLGQVTGSGLADTSNADLSQSGRINLRRTAAGEGGTVAGAQEIQNRANQILGDAELMRNLTPNRQQDIQQLADMDEFIRDRSTFNAGTVSSMSDDDFNRLVQVMESRGNVYDNDYVAGVFREALANNVASGNTALSPSRRRAMRNLVNYLQPPNPPRRNP